MRAPALGYLPYISPYLPHISPLSPPYLPYISQVAACVRQLWAKRAQMEKTSTSPVPYPKVFRAVKAEEMAQPGGGTGMHRGRTLTLTLILP